MISAHTNLEDESRPAHRGKQFGYVIHDLARLMRRHFDAEAQRHGMTLPQWRVIAQLSITDGLSQVALAGRVDTDPMTLSGLVERLESKGLVVRAADPDDSRAKIVMITDQARAVVAEMKELADRIAVELFQGINDTERATALRVLHKMSENLSKQRAPGKEELV